VETRFDSVQQMPVCTSPVASFVHYLGNPRLGRQLGQAVWGHREKGAKNSHWKSL